MPAASRRTPSAHMQPGGIRLVAGRVKRRRLRCDYDRPGFRCRLGRHGPIRFRSPLPAVDGFSKMYRVMLKRHVRIVSIHKGKKHALPDHSRSLDACNRVQTNRHTFRQAPSRHWDHFPGLGMQWAFLRAVFRVIYNHIRETSSAISRSSQKTWNPSGF
jgi:hypothetical protein